MGDGVRVRLAAETTVTTTMERRKFVIGAGALATGSAAAIGSGAFTSVEADRDVDVQVVGDQSAMLEIDRDVDNREAEPSPTPNANEYVNFDSDGVASIDIPDLNRESDAKFANLLKVTNQGTHTVRFGYVTEESDGLGDPLTIFAEGPTDDDSLFPKDAVQPDPDNPNGGLEFDGSPLEIPVGESVEGIGISLRDWDENDLDDTLSIVFRAEAIDAGQDSEDSVDDT